jgi:hypothetical protein
MSSGSGCGGCAEKVPSILVEAAHGRTPLSSTARKRATLLLKRRVISFAPRDILPLQNRIRVHILVLVRVRTRKWSSTVDHARNFCVPGRVLDHSRTLGSARTTSALLLRHLTILDFFFRRRVSCDRCQKARQHRRIHSKSYFHRFCVATNFH